MAVEDRFDYPAAVYADGTVDKLSISERRNIMDIKEMEQKDFYELRKVSHRYKKGSKYFEIIEAFLKSKLDYAEVLCGEGDNHNMQSIYSGLHWAIKNYEINDVRVHIYCDHVILEKIP